MVQLDEESHPPETALQKYDNVIFNVDLDITLEEFSHLPCLFLYSILPFSPSP